MKIRPISLLVLTLFLLGSCAVPTSSETEQPVDRSAVERQIDSLLLAQLAEWNAGSVDGFMEGYWKSDSLRFVTGRSVLKGHAQVTEMYKKSFPNRDKMGRLNFKIHNKKWMADSLLSVLGTWEVQNEDTTRSGNFCLFFQPVGSAWRIVEDHTW